MILYNYWVYNFGVILYNYWVYNCITLYIAQPSNHLRYQHTYTILYIYCIYIHTHTHIYIYYTYILHVCDMHICTVTLLLYLFSFLAARLWIGGHGGHVQRLWRLTSESAAEKLGPTAFCSSFQWNCNPCLYRNPCRGKLVLAGIIMLMYQLCRLECCADGVGTSD